MHNLAESRDRYEASARSFTELLPWMIYATNNLILQKDGSLLACYEIDGVDLEGMQQFDVDRYSNLTEHAMRLFDARCSLWWTVDRRRTDRYPDDGGNFPDAVSQFIDQEWRAQFVGGHQYENRHFLSVLYSPESGAQKFMDIVAHFSMRGKSLPAAFIEAAKASLTKQGAFSFVDQKIGRDLKRFGEMLASFEQTISDLGMRRLGGADLAQFLHNRASPASYGQPVKQPYLTAYLDAYLADNTLHVSHDTLLFDHNTPVHVAASSIKEWPSESLPGLLDGLLSIPAEITVSQCFRYVDQQQAKAYIDKVRKHNLNSQKSMLTYISEAMTNTESDKKDYGKVVAAQDASDAMAEITTHGRLFGYYNLSVLTYGPTSEQCEDAMKMVTQVLNHQGFIAVREKLHLLSAWAGTMPGQWGEIVRWYFLSTANLADMAPIRTLGAGEVDNRYLSEQTQRHCPALTVLSTEFSVPFYFNFHNGDLAHTMVVGPSRSGKSAFLNFLTSQFRKYSPCRVYIFDKDFSCQTATLLQGGRHIDMSGESSGVKLNPLSLLGDRDAWPWLSRWLELLMTSRGYEFKARDDDAVHAALESVSKLPPDKWVLRSLISHFRGELGEQLAQWVGTGGRAKYFDNDVDTFDLGDFTDIEMGGLFYDPRVASAFLDYAFYRISRQLDGTPTMIYVEEFWFMLQDERFQMRINDWLRTLAKRNAFLVFATQSLDELAQSDIFSTIIDNIPNRIFLPNPNAFAHEDLYTRKFGLNTEQVHRIRNAIPKQQYYIVTPRMARMAIAQFPKTILACVRSDTRAREVFKKHYDRRQENESWREDYINEMAR